MSTIKTAAGQRATFRHRHVIEYPNGYVVSRHATRAGAESALKDAQRFHGNELRVRTLSEQEIRRLCE